MNRKYWRLPEWFPIWLRNFILGYEPEDLAEFEKHCTVIGQRQFGAAYMPYDWKLIAAKVHLAAGKMGVSPYWLAATWADPQSADEGVSCR